MMNNNSFYNLIKNGSMMFALNIFSTIIGFFSIPMTLKIIGIETYGNLVFLQSVFSTVYTLLAFQYWQGLLVELPGKKLTSAAVKQTVLKSMKYESVAITLVLISSSLLRILGSAKFDNFTRVDILLLSVSAVLQSIGTFTAFFRLVNKYNILLGVGCLSNLIRLAALYLVMITAPTVSNLVLGYVLTDIIRFIILILLFLFDSTSLPGSQEAGGVNETSIIKAGKWSTIQTIFDLPVVHLDKIIIGLVLPGAYVGVFNIFKRIYGIVNMASAPFYTTSISEFSFFVNSKNSKGAFDLWKKTTKLLFLAAFTLSALCFMSRNIWMNYVFSGLMKYPVELLIVLATAVIAGSFVTTHSLYWSLGKARETTIITVSTNAIYLLALFSFCYFFGLTGAVSAFLVHVTLVVSIKLYLLNIEQRGWA